MEWLDPTLADPKDRTGTAEERASCSTSVGDHIDLSSPFLKSYLLDAGKERPAVTVQSRAVPAEPVEVPENLSWDAW